nr:histone-arginine methyltransferase CARM1-like [Ovis aries]
MAFVGSQVTVWLSTAPTEPLTHWHQVRCLLQTPLLATEGETLSGRVLFVANEQQSYDIQIMVLVNQTGFRSGNTLSLKNPFFRPQHPQWRYGLNETLGQVLAHFCS